MSGSFEARPLQVPPVTEVRDPNLRQASTDSEQDDLRRFHAGHFPDASSPLTFFHAPEYAGDEADETDDLGYYPDGAKRTLTDEQIAMFRHSEIQALLRERRIAREQAQEAANELGEDGELQDAAAGMDKSLKRTRPEDFVPYGTKSKKKKKRKPRRDRDKPKKKPPTKDTDALDETEGNPADAVDEEEDLMPRRIAREQDEQTSTWAGLEYD